MEFAWQDLRYGTRTLVKSPGLTLVAVLALSLGIGPSMAIFSVLNFVLLRPLEYANSIQLVMIWERNLKRGFAESPTSFANFLDFRADAKSVDIAAFSDANFNLAGGEQPERVPGLRVSANLFPMLGVSPMHGRWFDPAEERPGAGREVILSYGLWQRSFGENSGLLNREIRLDNLSYTVVGIMPPRFKFPPSFSATVGATEATITSADLWVPLTTDDVPQVRDTRNLNMIGRLKPGVTSAQAQSEINAIASRLDKEYPEVNSGIESHVIALHEQVTGDIRLALLVLMAGVSLVLLISCTNVANLLLAKATSRQKEIAIRMALGANRFRIFRQLLTESLLLGLLGGTLGLPFALVMIKTLFAFVTVNIPRLKDFSLDYRALLFTFGISMASSLVFGLVPAIDASKPNLTEALKEGGRSSGDSGRNRLRDFLVIAEVALATVLVITAGLMFRSFARLQRVNPGFNPNQLLTLEIELPPASYDTAQQQRAFQRQLLQRVRSLPEVQYASTVDNLPFSGNAFNSSFLIEGRPIPALTERPRAFYRVVSSDYFSTMGIPFVRGSQFTDRESADGQGIAIINEAAARKYWPGENPLGQRIKRGRPESKNPWLSVVGIVGSANQLSLREATQPEIYVPYLQSTGRTLTLVARASHDAHMLAGAIRKEIWSIDSNLPANIKLMQELISNSVAQPRLNVLLLGAFAALALLLAAVGVYGVMSYSVTARMHEIGIRMALGASPGDIFKHVVGHALRLALIGLGLGIVLAVASARVISGLLYGISTTDPLTLAATSLLLLAVALLASYVPARRAKKVDPMAILRYE